MYNQRLTVLSIGLVGCSGHTADGASITYYDRRIAAYFGELVEGGFVIVKTAVLDERPGLAVASPMVRGNLPSGARNPFRAPTDSIIARSMMADQNNPARGLAALMMAAPACGAFDDVAPDVYAAWWAEHGARVGVREGDTIVWTDGEREPIRPFASRYVEGAPS